MLGTPRIATATTNAMTGNPVNAGTYYLILTDNAISQLQKDNPNYKFADNAIGGEFTYTINAVAGRSSNA